MKVQLIAVVGGSGSGKSWLARQLQRRLGARAGTVSLDAFYRDRSALPPRERQRVNFDHPAAIDWPLVAEKLAAIKRGEDVGLPRYDFVTHTRLARARRWRPKPVVVVEGLWLLHRPQLRRLFSLSIYLDCPAAVRRERRIARDQRERGRTRASIVRQFRQQVAPMHNRFVAPQSRRADRVFTTAVTGVEIAGLIAKFQEVNKS